MALPTTEIKFDNIFIGRIPFLTGLKNYDVWSKCIISMLSAYSVWEFVDGTLTYAVLPAGADLADRQQKWKLLDKHILGLMASTIDNSLLSHVIYDWADPVMFPSISKALWNKLKTLFGTTGFAAIFHLFKQVSSKHVRIQHVQTNINDIISLFNQMTQAGLDLSQTFRAMILLNNLPPEYNSLASTIVQTITVANFDMQHVTAAILMEMEFWATHKPLHAQISAVQESADPSSLINQTNVIRRSPPNQNQWRNQTPSYQRPSNQHNQPSPGGYHNQQSGPRNTNQNQKKGKGLAKSKQSGKGQKKEWFNQQQGNKGKAPARANEHISFANEVQMKEEDIDLASRFVDHLEDQAMDNARSISSNQAHAGWGDRDDEDDRRAVAGPQAFIKDGPFSRSSSEKPLSEEEEITMGQSQMMMMKKSKMISFSLGGLASSSHHFNNIDQLDHIQTLLPTFPVELAMALPRDPEVRLSNYASDKLVYGYDSENDDDYYLCFCTRRRY